MFSSTVMLCFHVAVIVRFLQYDSNRPQLLCMVKADHSVGGSCRPLKKN